MLTDKQAMGIIIAQAVIIPTIMFAGLLSLLVTPTSVPDIGAKAPSEWVDGKDGKEFCDLRIVECDSERVGKPETSVPRLPEAKSPQPAPAIARIVKKNASKAMQAKVDYAWELSKDKDFVLMIEAESGFNEHAVNINKDGSKDLGIMQINAKWHKKIVNDKNFADWKWQMKKGYELYRGGTTFYGYHVRHKVASRFTYISEE